VVILLHLLNYITPNHGPQCLGTKWMQKLFSLLILFTLFTVSGTLAQKPAASSRSSVAISSVSNDAVRVFVNEKSGQLSLERINGERLLFAGQYGGTSVSNVRLNGTTYTNKDLFGPQSPPFTVSMPEGSIELRGDTLEFTSIIVHRGKQLQFRQQCVPMLEQGYGFVRVISLLKNLSGEPVVAGFQQMFDLYLNDTDNIALEVNGNAVPNEREWLAPLLPTEWYGRASGTNSVLRGRISGNGITTPDQFVAGNWRYNGYLGAPYWDYVPSGIAIVADNAVLMQWDEAPLGVGETRSIVTDYGVNVTIAMQVDCSADEIKLNSSQNKYEPDPFMVVTHVENTGEILLRDLQLEIILPQGLRLAAGESALRVISSPLLPGGSIPVSWNLHADSSDVARILPVTIRVTNTYVEDSCSLTIPLPAIPRIELSFICEEDLVFELSDDGLSYKNNPFIVTARVRNTGNTPINSISALITLPDALLLVNGTEFQFIIPEPLLPGQEGTATWELEAVRQWKDTTVQYSLEVVRNPYLSDSCTVTVFIPKTKPPKCVDNGLLTKGLSFHASMTGNANNDRTSIPQCILYIIADTLANVAVTDNIIGTTNNFVIKEREMETVVLSPLQLTPDYDTLEVRSFSVRSDEPVTIIAGSMRPLHSDVTLLLPDHALGKEYVSAAYNFSNTPETEHVVVSAIENNTEVVFTPRTRTAGQLPGKQPFPFMLQAGEGYTFMQFVGGAVGGLTGSIINANKPVAVMSGAESGHIPRSNSLLSFLNIYFEQIPPIELLGREYVAMPFQSRHGGFTIRVVAAFPNTMLNVGSTQVTLTEKGDRYEEQLEEATVITSNEPVLVAQFAHSASYDSLGNEYGDGSMLILPPTDRFASCHTFPTGLGSHIDSAGERFSSSFLNIVAFDGGQSSVSWNGVFLPDTMFRQIPGSSYWTATLQMPPGLQNIGTMDANGIGVTAYSFEYHDALSYATGFRVGETVLSNDVLPIAGSVSLSVVPNPVQGRASIALRLPAQFKGDLVLYDALGRIVRRIREGVFATGLTQLHFDATGLSPGVYHLMLHNPQASTSTMMIVE
jgi:IgGFc binding protein